MKRYQCAVCAFVISAVFLIFLLFGVVAGTLVSNKVDLAQQIPLELRHEQPPALAAR